MKKNKGFTLIELVIVIAVIAILAAVLIPNFSSVVIKAKQSAQLQEAKNHMTEDLLYVDGDFNLLTEENLVMINKNNKYHYYIASTLKIIKVTEYADNYYSLEANGDGEHRQITRDKFKNEQELTVYHLTSEAKQPYGFFDAATNTYRISISEDNEITTFVYNKTTGKWQIE